MNMALHWVIDMKFFFFFMYLLKIVKSYFRLNLFNKMKILKNTALFFLNPNKSANPKQWLVIIAK